MLTTASIRSNATTQQNYRVFFALCSMKLKFLFKVDCISVQLNSLVIIDIAKSILCKSIFIPAEKMCAFFHIKYSGNLKLVISSHTKFNKTNNQVQFEILLFITHALNLDINISSSRLSSL